MHADAQGAGHRQVHTHMDEGVSAGQARAPRLGRAGGPPSAVHLGIELHTAFPRSTADRAVPAVC